MGISIKHDEIERLIRQLADQRQSSMVQAIGMAVRNELERDGIIPLTDEEIARRIAAIREIQDEIAKTPIDWSLTEDEILGYDEFGVPDEVETYDLSPSIELLWLPDGDHDLKPRKAISGFTTAQHLQTLADSVHAFATRVSA